MTQGNGQRRVVIIGGGFGGLFAARALQGSASVTLIDRAGHHLFAAAALPVLDRHPVRGEDRRPAARSAGETQERRRRPGRGRSTLTPKAAASWRGGSAARPGVRLRRPDRGRRGPAVLFRPSRVRPLGPGHEDDLRCAGHPAPGVRRVRDGQHRHRPGGTPHYLTFALVGAGPTGVELAGQIREVATKTLRAEFRNIQPEDARVLLFDGGSAPLAMFGPKLSQKAADTLDKPGGRAAHGLDRHPRRRGICPRPRPRRPGDALRRRHRAVDRRGRGPADGQGPRRRHRRRAGPGRAHRGREEPAPSPTIRRSPSSAT